MILSRDIDFEEGISFYFRFHLSCDKADIQQSGLKFCQLETQFSVARKFSYIYVSTCIFTSLGFVLKKYLEAM